MAPETPTKEPSASEAKFFFSILKHTASKPSDINWTSVAEEMGFKNAEVAKVRFGQVKRKLGLNTDSPAKRGAVADCATPTKIKKAAAKKGAKRCKAIKNESNSDDEMADEGSDSSIPGLKEENHEL